VTTGHAAFRSTETSRVSYEAGMRDLLAMLVLVAACGPNARDQTDAGTIDPVPDADRDAAVDAEQVPCTYVPATSSSPHVSFTFTGGSVQSFGCAPIDPTYWMSGSGMSVTVTFAQPQARPAIRVWGMNTDDTAAVTVNGAAFALDMSSASLGTKVVCGLSPGPHGVAFVGGKLAGANTPGEGNYSYQDITVEQTGVQSIQLTGMSGAGWGFVGALVGCTNQPNPL
jgi:hypothetical protein